MLNHLGLATRMIDHQILRIIERHVPRPVSNNPQYYALFMFEDETMLLVAVQALFQRLQWNGLVPHFSRSAEHLPYAEGELARLLQEGPPTDGSAMRLRLTSVGRAQMREKEKNGTFRGGQHIS